MKIEIHHYHHYPEIDIMSQQMDRLVAEAEESKTATASIITLLGGIAQQLRDAGTDKTKLTALADSLDADQAAIAAAVVANTAAADEATPPA